MGFGTGGNRMKKKIILAVSIIVLTLGGTTIGFAVGFGFFDNATIVQNNIDKLVQIAYGHKSKSDELQRQLEQNKGQQEQLQAQIEQLQKEKTEALDAKQKEIDAKQAELDKKQQEADQLRQQIDQLKQESQTKDGKISQYEREMERLADYSSQKVQEVE